MIWNIRRAENFSIFHLLPKWVKANKEWISFRKYLMCFKTSMRRKMNELSFTYTLMVILDISVLGIHGEWIVSLASGFSKKVFQGQSLLVPYLLREAVTFFSQSILNCLFEVRLASAPFACTSFLSGLIKDSPTGSATRKRRSSLSQQDRRNWQQDAFFFFFFF